jgi:hypothetical protein
MCPLVFYRALNQALNPALLWMCRPKKERANAGIESNGTTDGSMDGLTQVDTDL